METDKNYLMVGSFVLLTTLAAIVFSIWLAGTHDAAKYTPYRIRFSDSVSGLDIGSAVKFRGVNIGKVETIAIDPTDTRFIRVDVNLLKTAPIKTDTVASLKMQGITGGVFIELTGSSPEAPSLQAANTDALPEIPSKTSSIDQIVNVLPEILKKVSTISDQVAKLFSDQNIVAFDKLLNNLGDTSQQLNVLVTRTNEAAGNQYQDLYQTIDNLKETSRDIDGLVKSLEENPSQVIIPPREKGIPAP